MVLENVFFLGRDVSYFHIAFGEKVTELERGGGTCVLVYIYIKLHSWGVNWRVNAQEWMDTVLYTRNIHSGRGWLLLP